MIRWLRRLRAESGQAIILIGLAMPVFLGIGGLVIEGGHLFVAKRHLQNVADAAALAAARELPTDGTACAGSCLVDVKKTVEEYAKYNGYDAKFHPCADDSDTNCFDTPHGTSPNANYLVQVRVKESVTPVFANALGHGPFDVSAKATADARAVTTTTVEGGLTSPGSISVSTYDDSTDFSTGWSTTVETGTDETTEIVTPETVSTSISPNITTYSTSTSTETIPLPGGDGGVAFAMSTACASATTTAAVTYKGAGGGTVSSVMTNGGIDISGASKTVNFLAWGKRGSPGCDAINGGATVTHKFGPFSPQPWPLAPPNPAPPPGCTPTETSTPDANWEKGTKSAPAHPPGVYCFTGSLTFSANNVDFSGYTWYAPSISVSSTGETFSPASGQTTLFDAYSGDISLQGNGNTADGDIFAPNGNAAISGGGLGAGHGFVEAQTLSITGNLASYTGTGAFGVTIVNVIVTTTPYVIPGTTTLVTTPASTSTVVTPGSTSTITTPTTTITTVTPGSTTTITTPGVTTAGTTITSTGGTTVGLNE